MVGEESFYCCVQQNMQRRGVISFLFLLVLFAFALASSYHVVNLFFTRQVSDSPERNNLCSGDEPPRFCKTSSGPLQFDKFIWFVTDGLPVQYSDHIFNYYKSHASIYGIDVPGAKYSHAIYTSWLTGQLPTNYAGASIKGDQLLAQMTKAGMSLKYAGPEWSFLAINGKDNYDTLFTGGIDIHKEPLDGSVEHSYPFFFENKTTIMDFQYEYWPKMVANSESLIAHSGVFDHINHGVFRNNGDIQRLKDHSILIAQDLARLKGMIDQNPEYLLILSSDHGIDAQTAAGYVLHGFTSNGNEGYLMFYNPKLPAYRSSSLIDVVDVAPTISKYLNNVDIPFNSVGKARNYYGTDSAAMKQNVNVLKQNLVQLKGCSDARGKIAALDDEAIEQLLLLPAKKDSIIELSNAIDSFKLRLYNVMDAPTEYCIAYCVTLLFVLFATIFYFHEGRKIFSMSLLGWIILLGIYIAPLIHLLFAYEFYGKIFGKGTVFFLPNSLLTFLAVILWHRQRKFDQQRECKGEMTVNDYKISSSLSLYHDKSIEMLICVFAVNWFELAVTLVFGAHWKIAFSSWTLATDFVYVFAFFFLLWIHSSLNYQKQPIFQRTNAGSLIRTFINPSFVVSVIVLVLFRFYEYTEENSEMYMSGGIHLFVSIAASIGLGWLIVYHIIFRSSIHGAILGMHLFVFLLWMDSPTGRLLNLLWHMKNLFMYLPLIEIAYYHFQSISQQFSKECEVGDMKNQKMYQQQRQECILLLQCVIVVLINQAFYHLAVSMGDRISMDLHPFSGKVGVEAYDLYPIVAGFMMCFHKYGFLSIFFLYTLLFVTSNKPFSLTSLSPLANSIETKEIIRSLKEWKLVRKVPHWKFQVMGRLKFVLGIFTVYQVASVAAYFLLLVNYSPTHYIEGSAIYSALWGTISCCFILFFIVESILQIVANKRCVSLDNVSQLFSDTKDHSL